MSSTTIDVADFYVGRGKTAVYLGSLQGPVSPERLKAFTRFQGTEEKLYDVRQFQHDVNSLIYSGEFPWSNDSTRWPHEYRTSSETTWTYCYDAASVHIYQEGFQVATVLCNGARKEAEFPIFSARAASLYQPK